MRKNTQRQEQLQSSCYRTEVVRMRVTPVEKEDLARRAAQSGEKTLSDYLRKRALEFGPHPVVPEINLEVARELRRMSVHLHSLALFAQRASSTGQMPKQNYEILQEFGKQLAEYHLELKGWERSGGEAGEAGGAGEQRSRGGRGSRGSRGGRGSRGSRGGRGSKELMKSCSNPGTASLLPLLFEQLASTHYERYWKPVRLLLTRISLPLPPLPPLLPLLPCLPQQINFLNRTVLKTLPSMHQIVLKKGIQKWLKQLLLREDNGKT